MVRSFNELRRVNPGFSADQVYSLHLAIPRSKYPRDADVAAFGNRILERISALPDVESVASVNRLPLGGQTQTGGIQFEGIDTKAAGLGNVDYRSVTPDYFAIDPDSAPRRAPVHKHGSGIGSDGRDHR